ncbi:N-acetylmuramoyl-L-alanine amidase [Rickettsiella massiliensis]|uniref:N-acetylmuramoyl-L-alanine amidase n=1 Tax=Rickettsiella massiliensis TaxID=676517 RepID=UPI000299D832|nr:N-acetylmuramoyl-L-alanine amidase [Rickettsiella massiliensis]
MKFIENSNRFSAHYLIPETDIDGQRKIFQLVKENERAWHAGVSSWGKRKNINDTSIGIEIVNLGYKEEEGKRTWYPFSDYQIQTVMKLAKDIVRRYDIQPVNIIGHSDIAPGRKVDPGPLFPWKKLYDNGIGAWFNEQALEIKEQEEIDIQRLQRNLKTYGYTIEVTGTLDQQTRTTLQAFQMHFNPSNYSGEPDAKTVAILENLVQKYFPNQVQAINQEIQESLEQPRFFRA